MSYVHPKFGIAYLEVLKERFKKAHKEVVNETNEPANTSSKPAEVVHDEVKPEEAVKADVIVEPVPEVVHDEVKPEEAVKADLVETKKPSKKKSVKAS